MRTGSMRFWFGFEGRISRLQYWLSGAVYIAVLLGMLFAVLSFPYLSRSLSIVLAVSIALVTVFLVWSFLATCVKRLHDRDKSARWLWFYQFVSLCLESATFGVGNETVSEGLRAASLIIGIITLIDLGLFPGTHGPNAYGNDPLRREQR